MSCKAEIHVGDIGTIYRARVFDDEIDFDFSTAIITDMIFKMPNGIVLRKPATLTTNGSPATQWFLDYQVTPGDGVGSPGEFHDNEGPVKVQGYFEWADGNHWHSNVQSLDTDDQQIEIFPNLD